MANSELTIEKRRNQIKEMLKVTPSMTSFGQIGESPFGGLGQINDRVLDNANNDRNESLSYENIMQMQRDMQNQDRHYSYLENKTFTQTVIDKLKEENLPELLAFLSELSREAKTPFETIIIQALLNFKENIQDDLSGNPVLDKMNAELRKIVEEVKQDVDESGTKEHKQRVKAIRDKQEKGFPF